MAARVEAIGRMATRGLVATTRVMVDASLQSERCADRAEGLLCSWQEDCIRYSRTYVQLCMYELAVVKPEVRVSMECAIRIDRLTEITRRTPASIESFRV